MQTRLIVGPLALMGLVALPGCQWKELGCWSFNGCFNATPAGPTPIHFAIEPALDSARVLRVSSCAARSSSTRAWPAATEARALPFADAWAQRLGGSPAT
jgi:hypothetical protein